MTRPARFAGLILLLSIVCVFAAKLAWDEYRSERAREHVPIVVEFLEEMGEMPDSKRLPSVYEGPSVNEYAVAVWHYYETDHRCDHVEKFFSSRAEERGFAPISRQAVPRGQRSIYRQGEFEFVLITDARGSRGCKYDVSGNWYGSVR